MTTTTSRSCAAVATVSALCLGLGCHLDLGTCESTLSTCDENTDVRVEAPADLLIHDRLQISMNRQLKRCLADGTDTECRAVEVVFSADGEWVRDDSGDDPRWKHGLYLSFSFPSLDQPHGVMPSDQVEIAALIQGPPTDERAYVYDEMTLESKRLTIDRLEDGLTLAFDLRFTTARGEPIAIDRGHYGCLYAITVPITIECNPM